MNDCNRGNQFLVNTSHQGNRIMNGLLLTTNETWSATDERIHSVSMRETMYMTLNDMLRALTDAMPHVKKDLTRAWFGLEIKKKLQMYTLFIKGDSILVPIDPLPFEPDVFNYYAETPAFSLPTDDGVVYLLFEATVRYVQDGELLSKEIYAVSPRCVGIFDAHDDTTIELLSEKLKIKRL